MIKVYDEHGQAKDFQNYTTQTQSGKNSNANITNLNDLNVNYTTKTLEKQQSNTGYHTPPPSVPQQTAYANQLMNQVAHNAAAASGAQPPFTYMPAMMGTPGTTQMIHASMQDNLAANTRAAANPSGAPGLTNTNSMKSNKSTYPTNSWS